MAEQDSPTGRATPVSSARNLSSSWKSRPYWAAITPRWICQALQQGSCIPITGGRFRHNQAEEPSIRTRVSVGKEATQELPLDNLKVKHSVPEGADLGGSFMSYLEGPGTIALEPIQAVVKLHTRVPALYSDRHCQLQQQIRLTSQAIYETTENLIFNHPNWGLLNVVAEDMQLKAGGPPTLDLLDDMISRAWRAPDLFVMHPEALQSFHEHANKGGISLGTVDYLGSRFTAWRGLPILPTNKLRLVHGAGKATRQRNADSCTTNVLLIRLGEEKQGVISLFAAGTEGTDQYPFIAVDFMGIDDDAVASYLLSSYRAMAVLAPSALCSAEVKI